mgnify:CR=1 FL=1
MAGPDPRSPIAIDEPGARFRGPLGRSFAGVRVAWSRDLGGLPIDPRVTAVIDAQRATFQALGCAVEDGQPDFSDAREIFQVWRGWQFESRYAPLLERHRHQLKDTIIWNLEQGQKITGPQLAAAERKRTALYHRVREFMAAREFLILPVTQVPPFDVHTPYVTEINGVTLPTYIDWMRACSDITVTGLPSHFSAVRLHGGRAARGRPDRRSPPRRLGVLQLAYVFEQATSFWKLRPPLAT